MLPISPPATAAELGAYGNYAARLYAQLVNPMDRDVWISNKRKVAAGSTVVFRTLPGAQLPDGWYVHVFWPGSQQVNERLGPFNTKAEAENATA